MARRIFLQSLGCPKNLVDSELMLGSLVDEGAEVVFDPDAADLIIVNTCGFIGDAKRESVDAILHLAQSKAADPNKQLIVTGCLVQRYGDELRSALPEVDAFLGTGDFNRLPEVVRQKSTADVAYRGAAHLLPESTLPRVRTGHFFSTYLKVSEGCDHTCSFCIIPKIRGRHESRTLDSVVNEAARLAAEGVVELNLIAQDLTAFGRDHRDGTTLSQLLRELVKIDGLQWIRLLYNYPRWVTDELLDTINREPKICRYIDMPLQHISNRMLRAMRRERDGDAIRRLLTRVRERVPGVAIRTSFIVGFPGETESDFDELREFVEAMRFERVGVFQYSQEEGTAAAEFPDQIAAHVKRRRYHALMQTQSAVARDLNAEQIGRILPVLVCGEDGQGRFHGRLSSQAPEIDGTVRLSGSAEVGHIVSVRITTATIYDLRGEILQSAVDRPEECHYIPGPL